MNNKHIAITAVLVILVGIAAFYGGMQYAKNKAFQAKMFRGGDGNFMPLPNQAPAGRGNGQEQGQRMGRQIDPGENGGSITGEITTKDDKSITIKTRDGSSKIVYFSDSTTVGKTTQGSVSDLATGQNIMVNGQSSPDGSVSAQNIQISSEDSKN